MTRPAAPRPCLQVRASKALWVHGLALGIQLAWLPITLGPIWAAVGGAGAPPDPIHLLALNLLMGGAAAGGIALLWRQELRLRCRFARRWARAARRTPRGDSCAGQQPSSEGIPRGQAPQCARL